MLGFQGSPEAYQSPRAADSRQAHLDSQVRRGAEEDTAELPTVKGGPSGVWPKEAQGHSAPVGVGAQGCC